MSETQVNEKFLTKSQLASRWAVSVKSIANFEERGVIARTSIGGNPRFALSDIIAAEAAGREPVAAEQNAEMAIA